MKWIGEFIVIMLIFMSIYISSIDKYRLPERVAENYTGFVVTSKTDFWIVRLMAVTNYDLAHQFVVSDYVWETFAVGDTINFQGGSKP